MSWIFRHNPNSVTFPCNSLHFDRYSNHIFYITISWITEENMEWNKWNSELWNFQRCIFGNWMLLLLRCDYINLNFRLRIQIEGNILCYLCINMKKNPIFIHVVFRIFHFIISIIFPNKRSKEEWKKRRICKRKFVFQSTEMNFHKWVWKGGKLETWFLYFQFPLYWIIFRCFVMEAPGR